MLTIIDRLFSDPEFQKTVKYHRQDFKANEKIVLQGETQEGFYFIEKGKVRVSIHEFKSDGAKIHPGIAELGSGDIFGELNLFISSKASADVVAVVDTEVVKIELNSFRVYLEKHQEFGYEFLKNILQTLSARFLAANKKVIGLLEWGLSAYKIDKDLK